MQIHGPGQIHGPQPLSAPHRNPAAPSAPSGNSAIGREIDQLDISPKADFVSRVRDLPEVRQEVVARIRAQIEAGTYESDEKLDITVERLLDELGD